MQCYMLYACHTFWTEAQVDICPKLLHTIPAPEVPIQNNHDFVMMPVLANFAGSCCPDKLFSSDTEKIYMLVTPFGLKHR